MIKNSLLLRKHKRKIMIMSFRMKFINLVILMIVFSISVYMLRTKADIPDHNSENEDESVSVLSQEIRSVKTDEKVYAFTVNLFGYEDTKDLELTVEVLSGLKIPAAFFACTSWLGQNSEKVQDMMSMNFEFGLLFSANTEKESREEIMLTLAKENDKFYKVCGRYPKYIRIMTEKSSYLYEVISMFNLYNISSNVIIEKETDYSISGGDICSLEVIKSNSPYVAARFAGVMIDLNYKAIPLSELIYDIHY